MKQKSYQPKMVQFRDMNKTSTFKFRPLTHLESRSNSMAEVPKIRAKKKKSCMS